MQIHLYNAHFNKILYFFFRYLKFKVPKENKIIKMMNLEKMKVCYKLDGLDRKCHSHNKGFLI